MLESYGVESQPTTVKNPQANAIVERIQLLIAEQLRAKIFEDEDNFEGELENIIQSCAYGVRATTPARAPYSPAELVFGHDMIFRQKVIVDWELEKQRKIKFTKENNEKENSKRREHEYKVGDLVLLVTPQYERRKQPKISSPTEGPYEILRVFRNGIISIQRGA